MTFVVAAILACAQDQVRLKDSGGGYRGTLLRWDDAGVALQWGPRGEVKEWPLEQVAEVSADRGPDMTAAENAHQAGQWDEAERLYRIALEADARGWARDRILANLAKVHRARGNLRAQAERFVQLAPRRSDAAFIALAPLRWLPQRPLPEGHEQLARQWLDEGRGNPLARLLAANWLLDTPHAADGEKELEKLLTDPDARVRPLAMAMLARRRFETTGQPLAAGDLKEFRDEVRKLPSALRGGPQHVLATMEAAGLPAAEAALGFLQVPLVHGGPPEVQADAYRQAAALTRKAGFAADAAKIEAELAKRFPERAANAGPANTEPGPGPKGR